MSDGTRPEFDFTKLRNRVFGRVALLTAPGGVVVAYIISAWLGL